MTSAMDMTRRPTTPGEILSEEYLIPMGVTQGDFARRLGVDIKTINRVVKGRTRVTAELALKLGRELETTPEFWLNLQTAVDVFDAKQAELAEAAGG